MSNLTTRRSWLIPVAIASLLAGCEGSSESMSGDAAAEKLDEAAEQSDPAARQVIERRADEARGMPSVGNVDDPDSYVQDTMEEAGRAAATQAP